jgi:hypothetical protein
MSTRQMVSAHKVTVEISTSVLYPWEVGDYFKHKGRKYRIERIISEVKYSKINGVISEITENTSIEDRVITSLVVGTSIE